MGTVVGVFTERHDADDTINFLKDQGYKPADMSIIVKEENQVRRITDDDSTTASSAATGALAGGAIGGVAGLLIGVGALAIPGVGAVLLAGPIVSMLGLTGVAASTASGALTGALAGGLIGLLVSLGIPEEDARYYENQIRSGAVLVLVSVDRMDEGSFVEDTMKRYNAQKVQTLETVNV